MELTVKSGDPKKDNTIASELGELGTHIFVDRDYFDSRANIATEMERYLPKEHLDTLRLSLRKRALMEEVRSRLAYMWYHVPRGKAVEKPFFARKMQAARRIVQRAYETVLSGASDDDTELVVMDFLSKADTLVGFTFDAPNSGVLKSVTVTGMPNMMGAGAGVGFMDPDTKEAMKEMMRRRQEEQAAAKS